MRLCVFWGSARPVSTAGSHNFPGPDSSSLPPPPPPPPQTWLQSLTYTGIVTAYGEQCYSWSNPALADTVYLESVQGRLPVMWQASYNPGHPTYQVLSPDLSPSPTTAMGVVRHTAKPGRSGLARRVEAHSAANAAKPAMLP